MRQFLFGVAGLILILAAIDIVWAHKVSEPPTADDNGALTSRGQVDRRQDLMWGSLFLIIGGGTALVSIAGLIWRQPMLEIDDDGVTMRLLSGNETMHIPFHRMTSVRSGSDDTPGAAVNPRQLLIGVDEPERFPDQLWGAEWQDNVLRVDTDGWSETAEEIAVRLGIDRARADARDAAARSSLEEHTP
ncbi:MAG: hypothetical protein GY720_17525 [bacterium]|nr:hypothetical protein [bacterium]